MKYEIVALFDNNSTCHMDNIVIKLCRKYKLNRTSKYPYVHIGTVSNVKTEKFDELDSLIYKIIKPYKKFKVQLNNNIIINEENKLINLKIQNKGYMTRICRNINDILSLSGFNVKYLNEEDELYIPLASTIINKRNYFLKNNNFHPLWSYIQDDTFKISEIEIWQTFSNSKKDCLVKTYELRDY